MRNTIIAGIITLLSLEMLQAHTVKYVPNPMNLNFGGADGSIIIAPTLNETCVVKASAAPLTVGGPPLVSVTPEGSDTAVTVTLKVHVSRAPQGGTETVLVTGSWFATGAPNPMECGGSGDIQTIVTVSPQGAMIPMSISWFPNSGFLMEPVATSTGELFGHDETEDLNLGGPLPLIFRRYYASFLSANGMKSALGTNWMHNFDLKLAVTGNTANVTLFRGQMVTFTRSGNAWQLSSTELRPYQLAVAGSGYQFLDAIPNLIYNFDASGALTQIADRNGNTLAVTQSAGGVGPSSVTDGAGRTLTFAYTGANLARVQDPTGRSLSYEYTGGNLSAWTDANGKRTTWTYTSAANVSGLMAAETRPAGNRLFSQQFDSQARVSSQSDAISNTMSLAYSSNGATVTEPMGVSLTHAHDAKFNLLSESDPSGARSQYTYDASGHPTSITDRTGARTSATWDPQSGMIASFTDEAGNTTNLSYTATNQGPFTFYDLSGVRFPDGSAITLTLDAKGNVTSVTDQLGNTWQAAWNQRGELQTLTNPSGGMTTFSYGVDGTLASLQTDSGDTTTVGYDTALRPNLLTNPDNTTMSLQYDARDNLVRATDERGSTRSVAFDDNNNIKSQTDALGAVVTFGYDADDRLASLTDALGQTSRLAYDPVSRLQTASNAAGNSVTLAYDALNRPISSANAAGKKLGYTFDAEGRLLSTTDPLGRTVTMTRDARGLIISAATAANEKYAAAYDALGRITSTTDPLGRTTQYSYDPRGLVSGVMLPGGIGAAFTRNELGLITGATDPNGNTWTGAFDRMGRLTSASDPLGRSAAYQYDSRQRLSAVTLPQGSVQFTYDAAGHLTSQLYSDGTTLNYTFDANGRLTGSDRVALSYDAAGRLSSSNGLQMTRDPAGRITSVTYAPGKVVRYTYDVRGLVTSVADWMGGATSFTYDDARQLTAIAYPNGVREDNTFDRDGELASIRVSRSASTISSIALHRDALGRVTSADRSAPAIPDIPASYLPLAYDAAHQSFAATYDPVGRVTSDSSRTYTWDLASRLSSYSGNDGAASFTYDGLGQRTSRTSGGSTQNYVINYALQQPSVSMVRSGSGDLRYYVWLPSGVLLYSIEAADNKRHFYHFDETGSTNYLTTDMGEVSDTYALTPYGETVAQTGSTENPFTFQGAFGVAQEGATGLYYMRARYYDSASARFLSRDPVRSRDPRALNPYPFAMGNPVEGIDPLGTSSHREPPSIMRDVPNRDFDAWVWMNANQSINFSPSSSTLPNTAPPGSVTPINLLPWLDKLFVGMTTGQDPSAVSRSKLTAFIIRSSMDEGAITNYLNFAGGMFCDFLCNPGGGLTGQMIQTNPELRYIETMHWRGYTRGCSPSTFCPEAHSTRGQLAVFLIRARMGDVFPTSLPVVASPIKNNFGVFGKGQIPFLSPTEPRYLEFIQKMRALRISGGMIDATDQPAFDPNTNRP